MEFKRADLITGLFFGLCVGLVLGHLNGQDRESYYAVKRGWFVRDGGAYTVTPADVVTRKEGSK